MTKKHYGHRRGQDPLKRKLTRHQTEVRTNKIAARSEEREAAELLARAAKRRSHG